MAKIKHHIIANDERLPLATPRHGEGPDFADGGEQCEGCGCDLDECLTYDAKEGAFICECGEHYAVRDGGFTEEDCEGHPAGPFDPMGSTVYCDGSCRGWK